MPDIDHPHGRWRERIARGDNAAMRGVPRLLILVSILAWGCGGGDDGGSVGDDSGANDGGDPGDGAGDRGDDGTDGDDSGDDGEPPPPVAVCADPVEPVDTSRPDRIVGDGSAASCTEADLAAALAAGGVVTFACGDQPVTIAVTAPLVVTDDTVVDGADLVTLDGGDATRILELASSFDLDTPSLTVQRMRFERGNSPAGGDDTEVGGGAIYKRGGALTVIDSTFVDNHAPATGQDVAGGAIYGFGGGPVVIVGSSFSRNSASDGGAVGSLQTDLTIVNSTLADNAATGTGGNPGNGGAGGAVYLDGTDQVTVLCGAALRDNRAGAIGGGLFRVSNTGDGTFAMDASSVSGNQVPAGAESSLAGGMYLQGLAITITASTISANQADYGGGVWLGQDTTVDITNVTIAGNRALAFHGGGLWLAGEPTGTLLNVTITGNQSSGDDGQAGAIFGPGDGLTIKNAIIDGQSVGNPFSPISCDQAHADGGGNVQWPVQREEGGSDDPDALCAAGALVADPMLVGLSDNGGPTLTSAPASQSPAIGLGTGCPETDQRGLPRGEPCTSGAVEVAAD